MRLSALFATLLAALAASLATPRAVEGQYISTQEAVSQAPQPFDARLSYGADSLHFGELRLPEGSGPHPVAVVIHGGCWVSIATNDYMDRLAQALTEAGWATWNLEFRRIDRPGGSWPGIFQDVARGVDFLRGVAGEYGLDLERVVSIGHSSGGHLALWVAGRHRIPQGTELYDDDPLPLQGAISLGGIADLRTFHEMENRACGAQRVPELVGGTPNEVPERYAQASPAELLPMGVPQLLLTGDSDPSVPVAHAAEYERLARARGDDVVLHTILRAAHFEVIAPWSERWPDVARPLFAFLENIEDRSGPRQ